MEEFFMQVLIYSVDQGKSHAQLRINAGKYLTKGWMWEAWIIGEHQSSLHCHTLGSCLIPGRKSPSGYWTSFQEVDMLFCSQIECKLTRALFFALLVPMHGRKQKWCAAIKGTRSALLWTQYHWAWPDLGQLGRRQLGFDHMYGSALVQSCNARENPLAVPLQRARSQVYH